MRDVDWITLAVIAAIALSASWYAYRLLRRAEKNQRESVTDIDYTDLK